LQGVRVLDLTRLLPGAYATLLLADLGADVVKVEDPRGGDGMRTLPVVSGHNVYFETLNRNKRSITLDEGVTMLTNLVDAEIEALHIGQRVCVTFRKADDGAAVPMFRPAPP